MDLVHVAYLSGGVIVKITELEWIYKNKDKLSEEEVELLTKEYNFFVQYTKGELELSALKMVTLMDVCQHIYKRYN